MNGHGVSRISLQSAPYPDALQRVVDRIQYKKQFSFRLFNGDRGDGTFGLTFEVLCFHPDSYAPERERGVRHWFIVPAATYDEHAWTRWCFDRVVEVETHEACEFFKLDGVRPYAPHHGHGRNPYVVIERGTEADAKRSPGT